MSARPRAPLSALPPLLAPLGGALVWLAERIWPGAPASPWLAAVGAAALVAALALSLPPFALAPSRATGPRRRIALPWPAVPYALFVLALALYYAQRELPAGPVAGVDWAALSTGGWVLASLAGAVLYVFIVLAQLAQRRLPHPDPRRMEAAGGAGLSLALLLLLVVLLVFVFTRLTWQWDVAYFRITHPSDATRDLVQSLSEPIEVGVFIQADSDVSPLLHTYFDSLAPGGGAGKLEVQIHDAELSPELADSFKARGNGWIVLRKGEVVRPIFVGDTIERGRTQLRVLDRTFFQRLLELSRPRQVVYLTTGHGERTGQGSILDRVSSMSRFRNALRDRNFAVKELGINEGLGERVPADAALVVIAAPTEPFLPVEAESLRRYLAGGGALLAYLEPGPPGKSARGLAGTTLTELLKPYGVEFDPVPQANDRIYARRTYTKADHALLVTVAYQVHASVSTLHQAANQFPLVLLGAGALHLGKAPDGLEVAATIEGMPGTWGDLNGNFEFDAPREKRAVPILAVAVSPKDRPKPRPAGGSPPPAAGPSILVFADADMAGDLLLQNRANLQVLDNGLEWLVPQRTPIGLPASEEDVRIQHARADDWLWFYLPVLGVPALVLGFGLVRVARLRRRTGGGTPPEEAGHA